MLLGDPGGNLGNPPAHRGVFGGVGIDAAGPARLQTDFVDHDINRSRIVEATGAALREATDVVWHPRSPGEGVLPRIIFTIRSGWNGQWECKWIMLRP